MPDAPHRRVGLEPESTHRQIAEVAVDDQCRDALSRSAGIAEVELRRDLRADAERRTGLLKNRRLSPRFRLAEVLEHAGSNAEDNVAGCR